MQGLAQFWRQMTTRPARQAFGLAPQGAAWALVGLSLQGADVARVQTSTVVEPPDPLADAQVHARVWRQALASLVQDTRVSGAAGSVAGQVRQRGPVQARDQRLQLAWPADRVVSGQTEFPPDWPDEDCTAEVQLAVAQALNLPPEEVNFDWQAQPGGDLTVRPVAWVGCAQDELAEFRRHIRAARWALASVEPEMQAALRAARAIQGGLPSLLTRPTQDWQFWLRPSPALTGDRAGDHAGKDAGDDAGALTQAVLRALLSPAGPRLVACGLALKAWL